MAALRKGVQLPAAARALKAAGFPSFAIAVRSGQLSSRPGKSEPRKR